MQEGSVYVHNNVLFLFVQNVIVQLLSFSGIGSCMFNPFEMGDYCDNGYAVIFLSTVCYQHQENISSRFL